MYFSTFFTLAFKIYTANSQILKIVVIRIICEFAVNIVNPILLILKNLHSLSFQFSESNGLKHL